MSRKQLIRVGIGGPVGSGKTTLALQLCRELRDRCNMAVVTNDIYTREDAEALRRSEALPEDRIVGVETGGCPHTAIRDDIAMNLEAIRELEERIDGLELVLRRERWRQPYRDFLTRARRPFSSTSST